MSQEQAIIAENAQPQNQWVGETEEKPKNIWKMRLKTLFQQFYQLLSSPVGLVVALAAYTFLGAAIFQAIEGPPEEQRRNELIQAKANVTKSYHSLLALNFSVQVK